MATDTTVAAEPAGTTPTPSPDDDSGRRVSSAAILVPVVVLLVAGVLRFWGLGHPERIYFDETYYAPQGQEMIARGVEEGFAVHPPVGKWLIGGGIATYGYHSFGFRAAAAAAGTLLTLVTYLIGLRLFRRRGVAAMAALFVALDGLTLTMSRIAMLDIFLALFVALGAWLLLIDRDRMWEGLPAEGADAPALSRLRGHPWRWFAGIAFGLALATKWSAVLALAGACLVVGFGEALWRRRLTGSPWTGLWRGAVNAVITLLVVPVLVYLVSYAGWFTNFAETRLGLEQCPNGVCRVSTLDIVGQWWGEQQAIARFHGGLEAEHPYRSHPRTWPYLGRPVAYYYESCDDQKLADGECVVAQGNVAHILGTGNPAIWWLGLGALAAVLWYAIVRRDWRAWVILAFYGMQYLPWLFVQRPNFLFYMTPAVAFLCLALAYAVWRVGSLPYARWVPAVVAASVVGAFVFWYPVWVGMEIPIELWQLRMWFPSWI
ncbi:MAG TPA: phospholipid carrier-dependent glycosyltransferase [Egibacteraceae bacterium]|nr:phospholipid carrier-dependent glycosyltransferase [Egibacteraceae bacterium]